MSKLIFDTELTRSIDSYQQQHLSVHRLKHIEGVANVCLALAKKYGDDEYMCYVAGLAHDIAKAFTQEEYLKYIEMYNIPVTQEDINAGSSLLHAKVGAEFLKHEFGVDNENVYNAIFYHTVGRPAMGLTEKILFIADFIEPGRNMNSAVPLETLRKNAFEDLNITIARIYYSTMTYLKSLGNEQISPESIVAYDYYKQYLTINQ